MSEPFVDIATAAQFLAVKKSWLYEQVRLNRVPSYKVGPFRRFSISELEHWVATGRNGNGNGSNGELR